jgi:hypothetical protein
MSRAHGLARARRTIPPVVAAVGLVGYLAIFPLEHVWADRRHSETLAMEFLAWLTVATLLGAVAAGWAWPRWRTLAFVTVLFVLPSLIAGYAESSLGWEPLVESSDPKVSPQTGLLLTPVVLLCTLGGLGLRRWADRRGGQGRPPESCSTAPSAGSS